VAIKECVDFAENAGYARDLATAVAMTIPLEFLLPHILLQRLERPNQTAFLRRDVWEERMQRKTEEAERKRLGFWPTIEAKWAEQDAHNQRQALNYKAASREAKEKREAEFKAIMEKANSTLQVAKMERGVSSKMLAHNIANMYEL